MTVTLKPLSEQPIVITGAKQRTVMTLVLGEGG